MKRQGRSVGTLEGEAISETTQLGQQFPYLNLNRDEAELYMIGIGGADLQRISRELPHVRTFTPDIVILEIGSNDLSSPSLHPSTLAKSLVTMAGTLCQMVVKMVTVDQILRRAVPQGCWFPPSLHQFENPRYSWALNIDQYNDKVHRTNQSLTFEIEHCGNRHISFWEHFGFWNPTAQTLHPDGVHLSIHGNKLYAKSIKWAILRARGAL